MLDFKYRPCGLQGLPVLQQASLQGKYTSFANIRDCSALTKLTRSVDIGVLRKTEKSLEIHYSTASMTMSFTPAAGR
jgi:hypothetical protein